MSVSSGSEKENSNKQPLVAAAIESLPEEMQRALWKLSELSGVIMSEYAKSEPSEPRDGFRLNILDPMILVLERFADLSEILTDVPATLEIVSSSIASHEEEVKSDVSFLKFSCFYVLAAQNSLDSGDPGLAWEFFCKAEFFLGAATFTNRGEEIFTQAVSTLIAADRGAAGGRAKHNVSDAAAKAIVSETVLSRETWDSRSQAAKAALTALGNASFQRSQPTVERWITNHPDLIARIPSYFARRDAQSQSQPKNGDVNLSNAINSIWSVGNPAIKGSSSS